MRWERAEQFVYEYMGSEIAKDLDEFQIKELTRRIAENFSDKVTYLSPHEVAKFADFQEEKKKMYRGNAPRQPDPNLIDTKLREAAQELDDHWYKETSEAFLAPVRDKILASRETVYYNAAGLKKFLDAAELPIKAAIENALGRGWSLSSFQRFVAGDKIVLETFRRENHPDPTSADAFRSIINSLGQHQGWALNQNGIQSRYDVAAVKAKASILRDGKYYPVWSPAHGQIRWHEARELDAMDPDQLLAAVTAAKDLYRKLGESREDQKERLQEFADAAAGTRRYRTSDTDSLDGQVRFREGSGARFEFVPGSEHSQAKPTADPKMNRNVTVPTNLPPHVVNLFTDESTGKFFTKTALHKLARTDTQKFRLMMRSGYVEFMNQLLAQPE